MKPLRPFFKYFGSKHRIIKHYPKPAHGRIIEPFAGSASYSLHYWDREITLFDADPRVTAIWRFLIGASPEDIMKIPLLEPGQRVDSLGLDEGPELLLRCLVNSSPWRQTLSKWKGGGRLQAGFWGERKREIIASQVNKIKHWSAHTCDFRELSGRATWFVDPPYRGLEEHYPQKLGGPHAEVAAWAQSRLFGQVIVCEKGGAGWLDFKPLVKAQTARHTQKMEVCASWET